MKYVTFITAQERHHALGEFRANKIATDIRNLSAGMFLELARTDDSPFEIVRDCRDFPHGTELVDLQTFIKKIKGRDDGARETFSVDLTQRQAYYVYWLANVIDGGTFAELLENCLAHDEVINDIEKIQDSGVRSELCQIMGAALRSGGVNPQHPISAPSKYKFQNALEAKIVDKYFIKIGCKKFAQEDIAARIRCMREFQLYSINVTASNQEHIFFAEEIEPFLQWLSQNGIDLNL